MLIISPVWKQIKVDFFHSEPVRNDADPALHVERYWGRDTSTNKLIFSGLQERTCQKVSNMRIKTGFLPYATRRCVTSASYQDACSGVGVLLLRIWRKFRSAKNIFRYWAYKREWYGKKSNRLQNDGPFLFKYAVLWLTLTESFSLRFWSIRNCGFEMLTDATAGLWRSYKSLINSFRLKRKEYHVGRRTVE